MNDRDNLKPCTCICGKIPIVWVDCGDPVHNGCSYNEYCVSCSNCGISTKYSRDRDFAIKEWNSLIKKLLK